MLLPAFCDSSFLIVLRRRVPRSKVEIGFVFTHKHSTLAEELILVFAGGFFAEKIPRIAMPLRFFMTSCSQWQRQSA